MKPNILCVGHVNLDEILYTDKELRQERSSGVDSIISAGGGATNTATVLSNNENIGDVYLAGDVRSDVRGKKVVESLSRNGVELALEPNDSGKTTKIRAVITPGKNPQYMHEDESMSYFEPDDIDDNTWDLINHVHITSFDVDIATLFAERAKDENITVSFNPTQGYFDESFESVVELSDLVQMNRGESEEFTKRHGSVGAVVNNETDVVVTHGPAGSTFYSPSNIAHHEGYTVENVIDTVGAGDSFMAGLISAWINDKDPEESLKVANAHGALSVGHRGSPESISQNDIDDLISS